MLFSTKLHISYTSDRRKNRKTFQFWYTCRKHLLAYQMFDVCLKVFLSRSMAYCLLFRSTTTSTNCRKYLTQNQFFFKIIFNVFAPNPKNNPVLFTTNLPFGNRGITNSVYSNYNFTFQKGKLARRAYIDF